MIRFENVSKAFGSKRILNDISFQVETGEVLFILGKSGMGKSVTLKHIVGVLRPDQGQVWVDQFDVTKLDALGLAEIRRNCGMVFQHPALLDSLSLYDNIAFGLRTPQYIQGLGRRLTEKEEREIVHKNLELVHLDTDVLDRFPSEISYGMQKRVSLARTLAPGPKHLLFDEPTTGLDPVTTTAVNDLILELSRALKVTSIVVSHDMHCALKIADRILVLDQAKILSLGTVAETIQSDKELIRDFLSEALSLLPPEERAAIESRGKSMQRGDR